MALPASNGSFASSNVSSASLPISSAAFALPVLCNPPGRPVTVIAKASTRDKLLFILFFLCVFKIVNTNTSSVIHVRLCVPAFLNSPLIELEIL